MLIFQFIFSYLNMRNKIFRPFAVVLLLLTVTSFCFGQYFTATPIGGGATLRFPGAIAEVPLAGGKEISCSLSDYTFLGMTVKMDGYTLDNNKDSTDVFYAAVIESMATSGGMSDMHVRDFTYHGIAGKDCNYALKNGTFGRTRVLFTRFTLYAWTAVAVDLDKVKAGTVDVFLDSFKLEN